MKLCGRIISPLLIYQGFLVLKVKYLIQNILRSYALRAKRGIFHVIYKYVAVLILVIGKLNQVKVI